MSIIRKSAAPRGSLAWDVQEIRRLLEEEERQKARRLRRVQAQDPGIVTEELTPPAPNPDRFPPGIWQHMPGVLPNFIMSDQEYSGDRPHGTAPAPPYPAPGDWLPPEWQFNTPAIDPRSVPGWEERTPVYCTDPDDPWGPPRPCRWLQPPIVGPEPPGGSTPWQDVKATWPSRSRTKLLRRG